MKDDPNSKREPLKIVHRGSLDTPELIDLYFSMLEDLVQQYEESYHMDACHRRLMEAKWWWDSYNES
jgi:hypothetical protein